MSAQHQNYQKVVLVVALLLLFFSAIGAVRESIASVEGKGFAQEEAFPDYPDDITRVYFLTDGHELIALPFEVAVSSLSEKGVTKSNLMGHVELKGERAETVITNPQPRFYVFVQEDVNPPPQFLIHLTGRKGARRFTGVTGKGKGEFSPLSTEAIKLGYRLLTRVPVSTDSGAIIYVLYVELRVLSPLAPGEYAIVGNDLANTATFRIPAASDK
jgi:hypothetical protein